MTTQLPIRPEQSWVLLSYRIPREPSTPRIAVWRKLRDLGVAQLGDGLVALPNDARTKEHLEWVAAQVSEANGEAAVWVANPTSRRVAAELAAEMQDARTIEYGALIDEINSSDTASDPRTIARMRREWRRIDRRDDFRAPRRDEARLAIAALSERSMEVAT